MTEQPVFNVSESLFQKLVEWQEEMEEINSEEAEETQDTPPAPSETKDTTQESLRGEN